MNTVITLLLLLGYGISANSSHEPLLVAADTVKGTEMDKSLAANASEKRYDKKAAEDLQSAFFAEERYYMEHDSYVSCEGTACEKYFTDFKLSSPGMYFKMTVITLDHYKGEASHPCSETIFTYDNQDDAIINGSAFRTLKWADRTNKTAKKGTCTATGGASAK